MELLPFSPTIQPIWDDCFQQSGSKFPFSSFAWHTGYFSTIGDKENPFILHLPDLRILAPFSLLNNQLQFSGGQEISDYMDIIGPEENKPQAWEEILKYLDDQKISSLSLHNVPSSSATHMYFQDVKTTRISNIEIAEEDTTPKIYLPTDYEAYLGTLSHKDRHELERKVRKFTRENPDTIVETNQDLHRDMNQLLLLMRMDPRKVTFLTPQYEAFFRMLPTLFAKNLIVQVTYVGTEAVAAILMFKTETALLLYNSGFNQIRYPGAGFFIKAESIKLAIEQKFTEYNFLQGNERYKYELGGQDFKVYSITITR